MANTYTNLVKTIYDAIDVISRELTGFIPAVTLFPGSESVALNQTVRYPVVGAMTSGDITPAATGPDPGDTDVPSDTMTITKSKGVTFYWTGDDEKGLGENFNTTLAGQFAQAMRVLVNEVEVDLAALYVSASRAFGTAGTTPFASTLEGTAEVLKILKDNGTPMTDLQLVIDTSAGAKLRTLGQLTKANEADDATLLRQGVLLDVHGFAIRESAGISLHTKGTGINYLVNDGTDLAIGDTVVGADTGTGTIIPGDVTTFAGNTDKHIVGTALGGGSYTLNENGVREIVLDDAAITVGNSYTPNMAFSRSALHLLTRAPAVPTDGDSADEVIDVTDPISGITFRISKYKQYKRVAYEVGLAWGVKHSKSEHSAILLG